MNKKEAFEIAYKELEKYKSEPKVIRNQWGGVVSSGNLDISFNEGLAKSIPLLAAKIEEISKLGELLKHSDEMSGKETSEYILIVKENAELQQKLDAVLGLEFANTIKTLTCNGTTDCENSPDCPEDYDGCIAFDIEKRVQQIIQEAVGVKKKLS